MCNISILIATTYSAAIIIQIVQHYDPTRYMINSSTSKIDKIYRTFYIYTLSIRSYHQKILLSTILWQTFLPRNLDLYDYLTLILSERLIYIYHKNNYANIPYNELGGQSTC